MDEWIRFTKPTSKSPTKDDFLWSGEHARMEARNHGVSMPPPDLVNDTAAAKIMPFIEEISGKTPFTPTECQGYQRMGVERCRMGGHQCLHVEANAATPCSVSPMLSRAMRLRGINAYGLAVPIKPDLQINRVSLQWSCLEEYMQRVLRWSSTIYPKKCAKCERMVISGYPIRLVKFRKTAVFDSNQESRRFYRTVTRAYFICSERCLNRLKEDLPRCSRCHRGYTTDSAFMSENRLCADCTKEYFLKFGSVFASIDMPRGVHAWDSSDGACRRLLTAKEAESAGFNRFEEERGSDYELGSDYVWLRLKNGLWRRKVGHLRWLRLKEEFDKFIHSKPGWRN